jgi:hypothetical protein
MSEILHDIHQTIYSEPRHVAVAHLFPSGELYEIQFDYGDINYSSWGTYQEARAEIGRLWAEGIVTEVVDFVAKRKDTQAAARQARYEAALSQAWDGIKAEVEIAI